jgi:hypothetical protein
MWMKWGEEGSLAGGQRIARAIRSKALEALERSDLDEIMELAGAGGAKGEAGAALKAILAERMAEYTIKAMKEARSRGTKVGAAAIVIAASRSR